MKMKHIWTWTKCDKASFFLTFSKKKAFLYAFYSESDLGRALF